MIVGNLVEVIFLNLGIIGSLVSTTKILSCHPVEKHRLDNSTLRRKVKRYKGRGMRKEDSCRARDL
jgi:hypothetical protein